MNEASITDIARESILVMMRVGGPILLLGLVVGILVSLVQTVTQIQEPTLAFVPKILIMSVALIALLPFMMASLTQFTYGIYDRIATGLQ
jgi:flagellar biosynthetic protein FliQ